MYGFIVSLHVIVGITFAVTVLLMQAVVGPAMSRLQPGDDKQKAVSIIQGRAQPAMDAAIIIQLVTSLFLLHTSWEMIGASILLSIKVTVGMATLVLASLLHFYWRGKKRRLKASGETDKFKALSSRTLFLEKFVPAGAWLAVVMGVVFNHF